MLYIFLKFLATARESFDSFRRPRTLTFWRRQLGDVIVKDANELIRVVCGDIVEVILGAGISAADLWPTGTEPDIYRYFPAKKEEKYWAKDFEDYLDHLDQLEAATQDRGHM